MTDRRVPPARGDVTGSRYAGGVTMTYGSVCSGIEAASCAWHPLGMRPAWFAEVAPFQSSVLRHRWPEVVNHGDFTKIGAGRPAGAVDVLVGGTPCQSFSVAGGRAGLDDPRGHLAVEFLLLARRLGARWLVWENVPGVLSVDDGAAFRTFLQLMVDVGYGVAYRVLDAQHFGVPQRRRRVFAVGYLGDWRPPVAVLFERPSMRRDPRSSSPAGSSFAVAPRGGAPRGERGAANALTAHHGRNSGEDVYALDVANTIRPQARRADHEDTMVVHGPARCITARRGRDGASSDQTFVIPIQEAQRPRAQGQNGIGIGEEGDPMYTCTTRGDHAVFAFDYKQLTSMENRSTVAPERPSPTITKNTRVSVAGGLRPRRLTPREVERCFGFADDYTLVPGSSDSSRYMALGNSMAVPVLRWIGERLLRVDALRVSLAVNHG